MKKILKSLAIFLSLALVGSQEIVNAQVEMELAIIENRRLNWNDFEAKPPRKTNYAAVTQATIGYDYEWVTINGEDKIVFDIQPYFIANKSWVKYRNPDLLNHEQGHYDIIKIFAYDLRILLENYDFSKDENYEFIIEEIVAERANYYQVLQQKYDEETQHGINKEAQQVWDEWIYQEIGRLSKKQ